METSQSNQAIEDEPKWIKNYKDKVSPQKGNKNVKIKFDMSNKADMKSNSFRTITSMQKIDE